MNKFDTHGGHYEPQGYMRVNAGGSHEENPNGGVQIGVDEEGTPNLLEEGEPVYNDYVYSDNITADEEILKKHNVPFKYGGKLYSQIADAFVDEAAEIPLDPISNNGLNEMLVRLADAQEEQKAIQQQRELEEELANLSPEELAELEQILSAQEAQPEQVAPEEAPMEEGVPEGVTTGVATEMPMMSDGGRLYWPGGTLLKNIGQKIKDFSESEIGQRIGLSPRTITLSTGEEVPVTGGVGAMGLVAGPGELKAIQGMRAARNSKVVADAMEKAYEAEKVAETATKTAKAAKTVADTEKAVKATEIADKARKGMKGWGWSFLDPSWASRRLWHDLPTKGFWPTAGKIGLEVPVTIGGSIPASATYGTLGHTLHQLNEVRKSRGNAPTSVQYESARSSDPWAYANGGHVRIFENGTPGEVKEVDHLIFPGYSYFPGFARDMREAYQVYDPRVEFYKWPYGPMRNDGVGTAGNIPQTNGQVGPQPRSTKRRSYSTTLSQRYPLYQLSSEELDAISENPSRIWRSPAEDIQVIDNPYIPKLGRRDEKGNTIMYGRPADRPTYITTKPETINRDAVRNPKVGSVAARPAAPAKPATTAAVADDGMLPTWPRYAGAVTSGLLGLYNAFQDPDKYTIPAYTPVLPEGRMHFIDPVYNPVDQNQMVNDVLASSAGTTRAINNSGIGPAMQQTLLAQDYNTGRNIGTALATAREANNQRLNNVIAQRNQNASALGQFNYGQSRDRAQILNDAAVRNLQNELYRQRLNYAAEGEKYAAIQQQLDSVAQALSGIGRENAAMNMINGDEAYAYGLSRLFDPYYKGHIVACGGKIKKAKK